MTDITSREGLELVHLACLGIKCRDGVIQLFTLGCPVAQETGHFCQGCKAHDYRTVRVNMGWMWGRTWKADLTIRRPRCHDGKIRAAWPSCFNRKARLPKAVITAMALDGCTMSARALADRHGVDRDLAGQVMKEFFRQFWMYYEPQLPDGFQYIALDVAHVQGRNHLFRGGRCSPW